MASSSPSKGGVKPLSWNKHLRPDGKRFHNRRVRLNGKKKIRAEVS